MIKYLLILVLIMTCASCRDWGWPNVSPRPFDAKVWSEFDRENLTFSGPQPRLAMLDDLRANHLNTGMARVDVVALLGKPDYRPAGAGSPTSKVDEYLVGASVSDPISFDCHYDDHDRLVTTRVVEH